MARPKRRHRLRHRRRHRHDEPDDFAPSYSPDGKRIAFTQRSGLVTSDRQVWTIDVQTKQRTRVTSDPILTEEVRPDWHPVFAPGSDRYVVWGDNACLGRQSLLGVLATLKYLAGIQNQGPP